MRKTATRGSDLSLGARTAAAHGLEALPKPCKKKCTSGGAAERYMALQTSIGRR